MTGNATTWSPAEQAVVLMERNLRTSVWPVPLRTNDPDDDDAPHNVIVLPRVATIRLYDGRSQGAQPIANALVRKITIKADGNEYVYGVFPNDSTFNNDWYPLITTPDYVDNPAGTSETFDVRRRREWVQHLRVWLRMLGRYSGAITGTPPRALPNDLGEAAVSAWASATKFPADQYTTFEGYKQIADYLTRAARGVFLTNARGELKIPLPAVSKCEVTVQFREHAMVDATEYWKQPSARFLEFQDPSWYCVPAGVARADKHKLTESLTFTVEKDKNDYVIDALTQHWCQPVYYEHATGPASDDRKLQITPVPIGRTPTLYIPTVVTGSGPKYGQVGFVRTYPSDQNYAAIREHGGKFYAIVSWGNTALSTHATQTAAQGAANISAMPPTTYRHLNNQWSVVQVDTYYGPFDSVTAAKRAKYHAGHDLAGLTQQSKVFALKGGRVSWVKTSTTGDGGMQLGVISHSDGVVFEHQYVHMHSIDVQSGQTVQAGHVLGTMGRTGNIDSNGNTPSTFPTHCHFALKRRAAHAAERLQNTYGVLPGTSGFYSHKPAAKGGPLVELRGVTLTPENKACVPDDLTPHLLPCGGEPNAGAVFSAGAYYRWKAARCPKLPDSLRDTGGTQAERNAIENACWALDAGVCPWHVPSPETRSRFYRYVFTGDEMQLIAKGATGDQVYRTWRAYSGRAVAGRELRREPGTVWDTVYYAKRFMLTQARQKEASEGPLPEGVYTIDATKVIDFDTLPAYKRIMKYRTDNWGEYGVRLIPLAPTPTHGRDGFYVHGGTTWGSAGCIDLRLMDTDFFRHLKADPDGRTLFEVTVNYGGRTYVEADDEEIVDSWKL